MTNNEWYGIYKTYTTRHNGVVGRAFKPGLSKEERKELIVLDYINELANLPDTYVAYWENDSRLVKNRGVEYVVRNSEDLADLNRILSLVNAE